MTGAVPTFSPYTLMACTGAVFDFLGISILPEAFALRWGGAQFEPKLVHRLPEGFHDFFFSLSSKLPC